MKVVKSFVIGNYYYLVGGPSSSESTMTSVPHICKFKFWHDSNYLTTTYGFIEDGENKEVRGIGGSACMFNGFQQQYWVNGDIFVQESNLNKRIMLFNRVTGTIKQAWMSSGGNSNYIDDLYLTTPSTISTPCGNSKFFLALRNSEDAIMNISEHCYNIQRLTIITESLI